MNAVKRVRLTRDVPVEARHGMTQGSEHDVLEEDLDRGGVWVQGDGERVKLFRHEWEPYTEVAQ